MVLLHHPKRARVQLCCRRSSACNLLLKQLSVTISCVFTGAGDDLDESDNASDDEDAQMDSSDDVDDLTAEEAVKRAKAAAASLQAEQAAAASSGAAGASTSGIEAALKELDMDNYDADEGENMMARLLAAGAGNVYQGASCA